MEGGAICTTTSVVPERAFCTSMRKRHKQWHDLNTQSMHPTAPCVHSRVVPYHPRANRLCKDASREAGRLQNVQREWGRLDKG